MAFLPDFQSASFRPGAPINNHYFPLHPGWVLTYTGTDQDGEIAQYDDVFVTSLTRPVDGVQTVVVRDTVYEDGHLSEDTLDYYAQDKQGNVWYLGETVINYEYDDEGNFIGTNSEGAWLAGVNGAKPGWIMPKHPEVGLSFFQEFSPGVAVDQARIAGLRVHVQADGHKYTTLKSVEHSQLEPGIRDIKYYAPGIGVVREEEDVDAHGVPGLVNELTLVQRGDGASHIPQGTEAAHASDFISDGSTEWVTIILEDSELENSLGYYTFNPATGVIGEAQIIFDGSSGDVGDSISIQVPTGQGVGFFLVPNSSELGLDLGQFDDGGLFLENMLTGQSAHITDGMAPVVTDENGNPLPISVFNVLGASHGSDLLNPGTGIQAVEWDLGKSDDGSFTVLGFEEFRVTEEDYDGDYNDLMIVVGDAPVDPGDFETIIAASHQVDPALHDQLI